MATIQERVSGGTRLSYSTKETAEFIRKALKAAFPGQKFSVTTSYASMTSSTTVRWTDGPTTAEVDAVTDRFSSRGFDGMTDCTTYHEQDVDGQRVSYSGWIHTSRTVSAALLEKAVARFQTERASYGLAPADLAVAVNRWGGVNVVGRDVNTDSGISHADGQYCGDAVNRFAGRMRANGCLVTLKEGR